MPGTSEYQHGIDVSHYQGDIDWSKVKADGRVFAYAKAAEGDATVDVRFAANWAGMKAAGILRGAYLFYVAGNDPETQARNFMKRVTLEPGDLPPMVDIETERAGVESDAQLVKDLHTCLAALTKHYGVAPFIYTGPSFWNAHFDDSFSHYPLWVAEYGVSKPKPVKGWGYWTIWQYSQSGSVGGVHGNVDLDYFNGSLEQLKKFTVPGR
ncbi:MAG: GH25 family lysozyme [Rhodobacter sp.]|nr:GH25 family lysozyme [Rhodobacter sp.]